MLVLCPHSSVSSRVSQEELASRIETERTKEEMRRAKEEKDQHDMAVLREQVHGARASSTRNFASHGMLSPPSQLENSEALVAGKSDELTQANDRIYDLRKKLKQCKDEVRVPLQLRSALVIVGAVMYVSVG